MAYQLRPRDRCHHPANFRLCRKLHILQQALDSAAITPLKSQWYLTLDILLSLADCVSLCCAGSLLTTVLQGHRLADVPLQCLLP